MQEKIEEMYKFAQRGLGDIIPKKTALIVVDMQKYQVEKDYTAFKSLDNVVPGLLEYFINEVEQKVTPNLQKLINFCHEAEIVVIYTKFSSFMPDGSDFSRNIKFVNNIAKARLGEVGFPYVLHPSSDIIEALKPKENDFVIQKNTSGTFISTRLDSFLRNMGIETVLVSGVVTNFCVHSTAREASDYGFQVIIVDDCCAAWSQNIHESTLKSFGLLYGFISPYEKLIKKISRTMKKVKEEAVMH